MLSSRRLYSRAKFARLRVNRVQIEENIFSISKQRIKFISTFQNVFTGTSARFVRLPLYIPDCSISPFKICPGEVLVYHLGNQLLL